MQVCELCERDGGEIIFRHARFRVVRVEGAEAAAYPGFCRVIWNAHVKEMSDLSLAERSELMAAVFRTESLLRKFLVIDKINLASLGNITPHLHWHVIPRRLNDASFPQPIWAVTSPPAYDVISLAWVAELKKAFQEAT